VAMAAVRVLAACMHAIAMRIMMRVRVRIMMIAMVTGRAVDDDAELQADERAALRALERRAVSVERKRRERTVHHVLGHAEVDGRGDRHVARDPRGAVEVQERAAQVLASAHGRSFMLMSAAA